MPTSERDAIVETINLYAVAVDAKQWSLFDRVFTSDVKMHFDEGACWDDLERLKHDFALVHSPFNCTQHVMTNHLVEVEGRRASALTYGMWHLFRQGTEGGDWWQGGGWYDDVLLEQESGWRISERRCRIAWWRGNPLVQMPNPDVYFNLSSASMQKEADEGEIRYLKAISA